MNALCTSCNKITKVSYKEIQHPKSIKETYIECEHCNDHVTCFVTDGRVREMQKKIRRLTGSGNMNSRIRIKEEVNNRMAKLKQEFNNEKS